MAKFPSANQLTYESGAISNDAWTSFGYLNLPKDLSILNRRGYASTTRKGVPLVYRVKFDLFPHKFSGQGVGYPEGTDGDYVDTEVEGIAAADFFTVAQVQTCANNWTMKNAAVKWHAAREKMFRDAGVKKKDRGAYSHEIRYGFDSPTQTWMSPLNGVGTAFVGGTWDLSDLSYSEDNDFSLTLVGTGDAEDTDAFNGNSLSIGHSYLMSRLQVPTDTNAESSTGPAKFSTLNKMLEYADTDGDVEDDVIDEAKNAQDNPPYDIIDIASAQELYNDITETVEAGRLVSSVGSGIGSVICDIPFGLSKIRVRHFGATNQNITQPVLMKAEVLQMYEMQG
jgi:hypothetical protein